MPDTLADQLRAAINASGQTVYRLAKETGTPAPIIHRFLGGQNCGIETLQPLADHLGMRLIKTARAS